MIEFIDRRGTVTVSPTASNDVSPDTLGAIATAKVRAAARGAVVMMIREFIRIAALPDGAERVRRYGKAMIEVLEGRAKP